MTSQKIQAQFARTSALGSASVSLSLNHGVTWQAIGDAGTTVGAIVPLAINLRDQVNGAYETLIRIEMTPDPGSPGSVALTGLTITTLTQVNAKALPRLNIGRNQVYIGEGDPVRLDGPLAGSARHPVDEGRVRFKQHRGAGGERSTQVLRRRVSINAESGCVH